ncbi:radical SAM protein [Desulfobacterales bacterium HSG17]|nr:radical SAM protein [Desulfobacterales bacterium HSG17]
MKKQDTYQGFEQGPIRPPSEASSLLIRLTRNCPWNRCTFCRVYKRSQFSLRSMENIIKDIDILSHYIQIIMQNVKLDGYIDNSGINNLFNTLGNKDRVAFNAAINWYATGMKSIFLQDANSLIIKPDDLVYILEYLKKCFPDIDRVTTYARSHTIVRIKQNDIQRIADAGLNRVHVGMETGSDIVLKKINKGATKASHIKAGLKIKKAGMQLSEYVMPGLGGIEYSIEHAMETASALNSINPDFIRIRTLAVTKGTKLAEEASTGEFQKPTDTMMAKELRLFIETLDGIDSFIKSDHMLNLFETIDGKMPEDKEKMINIIDRFFELDPDKRALYQVGRRMGFFRGPDDMESSPQLERVKQACELYGVTADNVDSVIDELMKRFI